MNEVEYRSSMSRVGAALVVVGLLDIGAMIYCIFRNLSYHSSFNIFAVVAGIFLIRGSLRAAGIVLWFATFMLTGFVCLLAVCPLLVPVELVLAELRLYPEWFASFLILAAASLGFLYSIVRQLREGPVPPVRMWGGTARSLNSGVVAGVGLASILAVGVPAMLHGQSATRATNIAASQMGPGYHYFISSMRWSAGANGTEVSAVVMAWNHRERQCPEGC